MRISILSITLVLSSVLAAQAGAQTMNGRFARNAGETAARISEAGEKTGYLGYDPYSSSYLPRAEGPLAKKNDEEMRRKIREGFGECDLVHDIIKANADKDTAAKFESAGNAGFRDRYLKEGYQPEAESWTGFCERWAAAGLDPTVNFLVSVDRIYADVPFGIGDLRELTSFNFPDTANYAWFGKRHNDKDSEEKEADRLDPADLLTIFENYVGEGKPGIVLDIDPTYMVWNQPFFKWKREATAVTGADSGPKKAPAGGQAFKVKLNATYGQEGSYANRGSSISRESEWNFFVYTDKNGNIVDSAWDGSNRIPDFAWAPLGPKAGSRTKEYANLVKIAKEGVKVDDIEEFCKMMAALPAGPISAENTAAIKSLLDRICPVLDQNRLSELVRKTAERTGQDYSVLEDAIRSDVEARG